MRLSPSNYAIIETVLADGLTASNTVRSGGYIQFDEATLQRFMEAVRADERYEATCDAKDAEARQ